MGTISIRLSDEDVNLFKNFAQLNNVSMSDLVRQSVLEKIEDEFDLKVMREAYQEYLESGSKSRPIEEMWKELNLWRTD